MNIECAQRKINSTSYLPFLSIEGSNIVLAVIELECEECGVHVVMESHWRSTLVIIMLSFCIGANTSDIFRKIMRSNTWNSKYICSSCTQAYSY